MDTLQTKQTPLTGGIFLGVLAAVLALLVFLPLTASADTSTPPTTSVNCQSDLVIESIDYGPNGSDNEAVVTIKNEGQGDCTGSFSSYKTFSFVPSPRTGADWEAFLDNQELFDSETADFAPGDEKTFTIDVPNCTYQVDAYAGPEINDLGPDGHGDVLLDGLPQSYKIVEEDRQPCGQEAPKDATLNICKTLVDENGVVTDDAPDHAKFSVEITNDDGYSETVEFETELDYAKNFMSNDGAGSDNGDDAECKTLELSAGDYFYSEESINSEGEYEAPEYNDGFMRPQDQPEDLDDYNEYNDPATDEGAIDPQGDGIDDRSDGVIRNLSENETRTLAIKNQLKSTPPVDTGQCTLDESNFDYVVDFTGENNTLISSNDDNVPENFRSNDITTSIPAGDYEVTLQAFDANDDRQNQAQDTESYFVELSNGGTVLVSSGATTDLAPGPSASITEVVNTSLVLSAEATSVTAVHATDDPVVEENADDSPNSLDALCAGFNENAEEPEEPATTTVTIIKKVINDDGGTATSSDFTLNLHGDVGVRSFPGSEDGTELVVNVGANYSVSETGSSTADYNASFSGICDASGSFTAGSSSATCTLTNNDKDDGGGGEEDATTTVNIKKQVINDDGGNATSGDFTLTLRDGNGNEVSSFAGSASGTDVEIVVDENYTLTESGTSTASYAASFSGSCSDGGSFTASLSTADCTITNNDIDDDDNGGGGGGGGGGGKLDDNGRGGGGGDRLDDDDDGGEVAGAQSGPTDAELNALLNEAREQLLGLLKALQAPQMPETGDGSLAS